MIIDASDIDCVILGKCRNVTLTDEQLRRGFHCAVLP